jgi:tRNA modification GTPase
VSTIAAIATPPGRGAIAIVRASGPAVRDLAARLIRKHPPAYRATIVSIVDDRGEPIDRGVAIFYPTPRSYTGEDLLELHVHGGPVVVREILRAMLACGARLAAPGEFTRRAFENGKIELSAAAAVADLIDAQTRAAVRAAASNLAGGLRAEVERLAASVIDLLERLAGAIDFPDEVPDPPRAQLRQHIEKIERELEELLAAGEIGRLVREGTTVAIVGPPNAGKSSLLNALLGEERALVSELPGTTRDTIEESIAVDDIAVRLVDTAGIRAHADRLESAGIERTMQALDRAAIALVVIDGSQPLDAAARDVLARTASRERIVFFNKADLGAAGAAAFGDDGSVVVGSVFTPATLQALRSAIARLCWGGEELDLTRPHLAFALEFDAAHAARRSLANARETLDAGEPVDLISRDLNDALAALRKITGAEVTEEVLDGIFARFCIGK